MTISSLHYVRELDKQKLLAKPFLKFSNPNSSDKLNRSLFSYNTAIVS